MSGLSGGGGGTPVGSVAAFPASIPAGWLECDGSAISRTAYAALFNEIGTNYGVGDGSTTFNIPDLRGEFIRGYDNGRGADSGRVLGSFQDSTTVESIVLNGYALTYTNVDETVLTNSKAYYAANVGSTTNRRYKLRPRNVAMFQCIKY